jgi:nucleoside-diphosphate-sugar epimerase
MSRAVKTVLVTGAGGYIGVTLVDRLLADGKTVIGLDRYFFGEDVLGATLSHPAFRLLRKDVRDISAADLMGVDAVCDLAALSNDPAGALDETLTYAINCEGRARLARLAREHGVARYVLASSCSVYGSSHESHLTEESAVAPVSTYAKANLKAENDVLTLASPSFAVTVLRQATVFGLSKRMRFDLVINLMTLNAVEKGKIFITGGGRQWRPVVHVQDTARAFELVLAADPAVVNAEVFNVGATDQNYQVLSLAYIVRESLPFRIDLDVVPDDNDVRDYNVSFDKIARVLGFHPELTPGEGAREIYEGMKLGRVDTSIKTITVRWYQHLLEAKRLADALSLDGRIL